MSLVYDHARSARIGLPEAIFCEGKSVEILNRLIPNLADDQYPILMTRLHLEKYHQLDPNAAGQLDYHLESKTAFINGVCTPQKKGCVALVTAGTSDLPVAMEASRTLLYLGIQHTTFADIGVAALWRLQERLEEIISHNVTIVCAGMDAAIVSVLGGLSPAPIIAVPTSVGYGAAKNGETALNAILSSCAPGIAVMNIDNGYGAACAAARIIRALHKNEPQ